MHVLNKMSYDLLHRRLGHLGQDAIRKTVSAVDGIDPHITSRKNHKCPTCLLANSRRRPFSRKIKLSHRPHTLNQVTYSDLKTGLRISFRGYTMFVVCVESASRHVTVGLMRNKMQTTESYIKYVQFAENVTSEQMMTLRTDGGTEYKGQLAAYNAARGIQHETPSPPLLTEHEWPSRARNWSATPTHTRPVASGTHAQFVLVHSARACGAHPKSNA